MDVEKAKGMVKDRTDLDTKSSSKKLAQRRSDLSRAKAQAPGLLNSKAGRRGSQTHSVPAERYSRGGQSQALKKSRNQKHQHAIRELEERNKEAASAAADASLIHSTELSGLLEAEGLEKTSAFRQDSITAAIDINSARKRFDLNLTDFGPYCLDYTRNGRFLLIGGRKGHVGLLDWQTGKLSTELHLKETVRAVKFLQNQNAFAVAQKRYVYMYDRDGVELHRMAKHVEVNALEYLSYHWLMASIGNQGLLRYQDITTGQLISELRTRSGVCQSMATNPANAIIHTAHTNGTVQLWAPLAASPLVRVLAHQGPVSGITVESSGRHMVTSGLDGRCKIWDCRMWKTLQEWGTPRPAQHLQVSQRGLVAIAWSSHVNIFKDCFKSAPEDRKELYLTHQTPSSTISSLRFCPYEDVLGVGHSSGVSSIIVPGAGEPNYDSLEIGTNPYASKHTRREEEVRGLLEKLQPDMIALDASFLGRVDRGTGDRKRGDLTMPDTFAQDDTPQGRQEAELRLKRKMRGRNSSTKRFLRKQQKVHIIDAKGEARKAQLAQAEEAKRREGEGDDTPRAYDPLARFSIHQARRS